MGEGSNAGMSSREPSPGATRPPSPGGRGLLLALVIALLTSLAGEVRAQTPALGMVLSVEGDVFIQRGAQKTPALRVDFLKDTDKLVITKGRADVLVCASSERWVLATGATVEFAAAGVKQTSGPAPERKPAKCVLPDVRLDDKDRLRFGGLQPRGNPPIALLIGGTVATDRPAFDWMPVKNAQSYEIALRDEKGDIVWQTRASSNHLDYPSAETALKAGVYQWEVKAVANQRTVAQQTANLEIKPSSEFSKPVPSDPADKLLRAAELENARYYAEAAALYRQLRDADPRDARIGYHLVWLYGSAGLVATANDELARLGPIK